MRLTPDQRQNILEWTSQMIDAGNGEFQVDLNHSPIRFSIPDQQTPELFNNILEQSASRIDVLYNFRHRNANMRAATPQQATDAFRFAIFSGLAPLD